jgi:hypothetical protein
MTWDRWLYFPSKGSRATDFLSPLKIYRRRPGLNPRTLGPVASTLTQAHRGRCVYVNIHLRLDVQFQTFQLEGVILSMNVTILHVNINLSCCTKIDGLRIE